MQQLSVLISNNHRDRGGAVAARLRDPDLARVEATPERIRGAHLA